MIHLCDDYSIDIRLAFTWASESEGVTLNGGGLKREWQMSKGRIAFVWWILFCNRFRSFCLLRCRYWVRYGKYLSFNLMLNYIVSGSDIATVSFAPFNIHHHRSSCLPGRLINNLGNHWVHHKLKIKWKGVSHECETEHWFKLLSIPLSLSLSLATETWIFEKDKIHRNGFNMNQKYKLYNLRLTVIGQ